MRVPKPPIGRIVTQINLDGEQRATPSENQRPDLSVFRFLRIPKTLFLLAILVGPVIGFGVYRLAVRVEHDKAQALLEDRAATAAFAIDRNVGTNLEVLFAVRSQFDSGGPVSRQSFAGVTKPFLSRHQSLRALGWAPRIGHGEQRAHEKRTHDEGFSSSAITEQGLTDELTPGDESDWYYPVTFVEPFESSGVAVGFDLGSNPRLRKAMDRAAATGEPVLSDPLDLDSDTGPAKSVFALLEVSDTDDPRLRPSGFVVAVMDISGLVQEALVGPGGPVFSGIHIALADDNVDGRNPLIYSSPGEAQQPSLSGISAQQSIDVGGQSWRLTADPKAAFIKPQRTRQPLLLGATSAVGWGLLVGLIAAQGKRTHDRIERRHARRMDNILGGLSDGVIVADTTGTILMANRAATAILGRGRANLPPTAWSEEFGFFVPGTEELFPPEELPLARAIRGEATENVEILARNQHVPDGLHVNVSGAPIKDKRGSVRGGVVVFRDISEQKRAEERLQRLSSAVEQTADSVMITNRDGTIEYVNPAFEATTGYSGAEALGKNPNMLKSGVQDQEFYRDLWDTILRGEPFRGLTINRKKNGTLYHAEQTITGIRDGDGHITHFVSVLKDMTERRKIQEQEIELNVASMVQARLYPSAPPHLPGYDLAGAVYPAEATCGDYFDFIPMANDAVALVVADVSGHGLGPALVMAETRAYLRSLTQLTDDLASSATAVNRFLVADLQDNFFVTMLLARLEPSSGRLTYLNSAHPSGYIIDASGAVSEELSSRCLPLGLFQDTWQCDTHELVLNPGELVVLVTDGVLETESPEGEEFGAERLLEAVSRHRLSPAEEIVEQVFLAVQNFGQDQLQLDDVTIVVCKRDSSE